MIWYIYLFVAWIICFCVDALVKTILPHEEMTQVANSYHFWRCASSSLECSHICALIYFIWGRILRELNTCSWIAYIATINSDLCMSSFIMYLWWCKGAVFPGRCLCTKFWWCYLGEPAFALPGNYDISINLHSLWCCWAQTTLQWLISRQHRWTSLSSTSQCQQLAGFHMKCKRWAAKAIKSFKK